MSKLSSHCRIIGSVCGMLMVWASLPSTLSVPVPGRPRPLMLLNASVPRPRPSYLKSNSSLSLPGASPPGKHTLEFDFKYDGLGLGTLAFNNMSGLGRPGTGTLKVDGKEVQTIKLERTLPMILQWDESFDIGSDTLTGVNDADYKPPFTFTGKLNKVTIKVDRPQLSPEDIKKLEEAQRDNKTSE